jgi:hypothetical protein
MAIPPPPYADITGTSVIVGKYNQQENITQADGNARPGQLVVDLETDPPVLYIGDNNGNLSVVGGGGTGGIKETLVDPSPIGGNYLTIDLATYNTALVTGNVTNNFTVNLQSDDFAAIPAGVTLTGSATLIFSNGSGNTYGITGLRASGSWGGGDTIVGGGAAPDGKTVLAQINLVLFGDGTPNPVKTGYITYTQID